MLNGVLVAVGLFFVAPANPVGAQPLVFSLKALQEVPSVMTDAGGSCQAAPNLSETQLAIGCENAASKPLLRSADRSVKVTSSQKPTGEVRAQSPPPPSLFFAQFGNGGGLTSDIVLVNPASSGTPIVALIELRDADGAPLHLDLGSGEASSMAEAVIAPLDSVTLRTRGEGDLVAGSATVVADGPVAGVIRFTIPGFGVAGVPAGAPLSDALVLVRNEGNIRTALAIRNTSATPITVTVTVQIGDIHHESEIDLGVGARDARFVDEIIPVLFGSEFNSTARISSSDGSFAAIALEQAPGVFTTLPVTPVL